MLKGNVGESQIEEEEMSRHEGQGAESDIWCEKHKGKENKRKGASKCVAFFRLCFL